MRALSFSAQPTNQEFFAAHVFEDPLVPIGVTTATDDAALAQALVAFSQRSQAEDYSALTGFLSAHPQSPWRASLLTGMGIVYAHHGYFTRALDAWQTAWTLSKDSTGLLERGVADRALSERARLYVRLGTTAPLQQLLKDSAGRKLMGSARDRLRVSTEMLHFMVAKPDHAFRCGPFSLDAIGRYANPHQPYNPQLIDVDDNPALAPTKDGLSLSQVRQVAQNVGLNYRMAKRPAGAVLPLPAVVHWKSGHYSAAVAQDASGRYLLRDSNFGGDFWISQAALDEESSGYILLGSNPQKTSGANDQASQSTPALPAGWQDVQDAEGATVWGGCHTGASDPDSTGCEQQAGGDGPSCAGCGEGPDAGGATSWGMATYSVHTLLVSLHIVDTPVGYAPPIGPSVFFNLSYSQREANQPANFNYMNFGSRWTCNWLAYVTDDPTQASADASVYLRGGGTKRYSGYRASTGAYAPQRDNRTVLKRTSTGMVPIQYQMVYADGSAEFYETPNGATSYPRKVFLTRVADSSGNSISLSYDSALRLTAITDAVHPTPTTITYKSDDLTNIDGFQNPDFYRVAKVADPFGRFATFDYADDELSKITDVIGLTSQFAYEGDFIKQLTTPYGSTAFAYSDVRTGPEREVRVLEIIDPLGARERFEFHQDDTDLGGSIPMYEEVVPQGMSIENNTLAYRNTFYWNKKSMLDDPSHPFTKAHIYHWLHDNNLNQITSVLESEKAPLENRVWYNYPNQTSNTTVGSFSQPSAIGRVLDDGSTQLSRFEHGAGANLTKKIGPALDPVSGNPVDGPTTFYDYDDATKTDLLMTRQKTSDSSSVVLEKQVYESLQPHAPTQVIDASGRTTSLTYYRKSRVETMTNAKGETTASRYIRRDASEGPADGYLYSVTGAVPGAITKYTYDALGRRTTAMDSQEYRLSFTYDALDRLLTTTYPDGTFTQNVYNRLDVEWTQDRQGRWTHTFHDALRRVVGVQDPLGRTTNYGYCLCGSMSSLTDPAGNVTRWDQDLQGRQIRKTYADGSKVLYAYENTTSRLKSVTDAMGQVTNYAYFVDNRLKATSYANAVHTTPTVNFTYDSAFDRLATMSDGTGTTTYGYGLYASYSSDSAFPGSPVTGAGRLASEVKTGGAGFASYTIGYSYDELGRQTGRSIDGLANQSTTAYDSLGRVSSVTNALGTFGYDYVTPTSSQVSLMYLGSRSGLRTSYSYLPNSGDRRLETINNLTPAGATISKFDYAYNAFGNITTWTQQTDNQTPQVYSLEYDAADQLTGAVLKDTSNQSVLKTYVYGYDAAANRTSEQIDLGVTTATANKLNQITRETSGGPLRFAGTLSKPATVSVNGAPAKVTGNSFVGYANVTPGTNSVTVSATDNEGTTTSNRYQVQTGSGAGQTLTYDLNGNQISDGAGKTYEWDAANRLAAISYTGTNQRTEFSYDGLWRRVRVVERNGSVVTSEKRLVWVAGDSEPVEERDASNGVTRRLCFNGEQIESVSYYTAKDHLGSVRELTKSTGNIETRYKYDLYGIRTKVNGSLESTLGFSGYYYNAANELNFTLYRQYDPRLGRWLSRDPLNSAETVEGANLYSYVHGTPINARDPEGLDAVITIIRDGGRNSPGTLTLAENGQVKGSCRCNVNGYQGNTNGLRPGDYALLPKNNYNEGDLFPAGQPSITAPKYADPTKPNYAPGRAGDDYPNGTVRIHNQSSNGAPDSKGCVTVPPEWTQRIWDTMNRQINNGGTRVRIQSPALR